MSGQRSHVKANTYSMFLEAPFFFLNCHSPASAKSLSTLEIFESTEKKNPTKNHPEVLKETYPKFNPVSSDSAPWFGMVVKSLVYITGLTSKWLSDTAYGCLSCISGADWGYSKE